MKQIGVDTDILASNDAAAKQNREIFDRHGLHVVNLMSGPGAGKTSILERTIVGLKDRCRIAVIEGDLQTRQDADRIEVHGVPVVQINTGGACHLDARLIHRELQAFDLDNLDLLVIENVGNLVCPAEFDLGEQDKVMVLSVTEGDDKPAKYPVMFHEARALLLNKIDLLPYVDFDIERAERAARGLNDNLEIFQLSAKTGAGIEAWLEWLAKRVTEKKGS